MQVTYFWIGLIVILLLLDLWVINSVWRSDNSTGSKAGWTALVLVFPLIGLAIWGIAGRGASPKVRPLQNTVKVESKGPYERACSSGPAQPQLPCR